MAAAVDGMHNTESPHSGGGIEATMATNGMQKNRRSWRRRCDRVKWPLRLKTNKKKIWQRTADLHLIQKQAHKSHQDDKEEYCNE